MKILHTSDWHIGKKLMNRDRLDEQEEVLNEIVSLVEEQGVELVLLAGDVFDTFLPSAEAENLFYRTVRRLAGEERAVLIISGNHDDSVRLSACAPLSEELGIYVVGNCTPPLPLSGSRVVRPETSGEGYVVFRNGKGERVYINALPYPNEARFHEERTEESYAEKMLRWIRRGQSAYKGDMPCIFLSHLFVVGGKTSEGEREIDLGGARAVELSSLPDCDYVALGHLHRKQHFSDKNVWYSGSPLQYSFDEAGSDKYVILLETDGERMLSQQEIRLTSGKKLLRLEADGVEEGLRLLHEHPDCHIELTLRLSAPLSGEESRNLLSHRCLKSLLPRVEGNMQGIRFEGRRGLTATQLFDEYYQSVYGVLPDDELKTLFAEMTEGMV